MGKPSKSHAIFLILLLIPLFHLGSLVDANAQLPSGASTSTGSYPSLDFVHVIVFSNPGAQTVTFPSPTNPVKTLFSTVTTYVNNANLYFTINGVEYSYQISPNSNTKLTFENAVVISNVKMSIDGRGYADDAGHVGYIYGTVSPPPDALPSGTTVSMGQQNPVPLHNVVFTQPGAQTKSFPSPSDKVTGIFATVTTYVQTAVLYFDSGGTTYSKTISPNSNTLLKFSSPLSISNVRISIQDRGYSDDAANVAYVVESTPKDSDNDGIYDNNDACPFKPETVNGYQDSDGCPDDPDSDGDGIPNSSDQCPNQAEDKDDYQDSDGCPEENPTITTQLPDLMIEKVYLSKPDLLVGQKTKIVAVVKNAGSEESNVSHTTYYINGAVFDEKTLGDRNAGSGSTEDSKSWEYKGGYVTIKVCVDRHNTTPESNENNNCLSINFEGTGSSEELPITTKGSISVNQRIFELSREGTIVNIKGNVENYKSGQYVTIVITKPDGYKEELKINANSNGEFNTSYRLDSNSKVGSYAVGAYYLGASLADTIFEVKIGTSGDANLTPQKMAENKRQPGESYKVYKILGDSLPYYITVYWQTNPQFPTGTLATDANGKIINLPDDKYYVPAAIIYNSFEHGSLINNNIGYWNGIANDFQRSTSQMKNEHEAFSKWHVLITATQIGAHALSGSPTAVWQLGLMLASGSLDVFDQTKLGAIHQHISNAENKLNYISELARRLSLDWSQTSDDGGNYKAAGNIIRGDTEKEIHQSHIEYINEVLLAIEKGQKLAQDKFNILCPQNIVKNAMPSWFENTIKYWRDGLISSSEFANALKYLGINGIIVPTSPLDLYCEAIDNPNVLFSSVENDKQTLRKLVENHDAAIDDIKQRENSYKNLLSKLTSQKRT